MAPTPTWPSGQCAAIDAVRTRNKARESPDQSSIDSGELVVSAVVPAPVAPRLSWVGLKVGMRALILAAASAAAVMGQDTGSVGAGTGRAIEVRLSSTHCCAVSCSAPRARLWMRSSSQLVFRLTAVWVLWAVAAGGERERAQGRPRRVDGRVL